MNRRALPVFAVLALAAVAGAADTPEPGYREAIAAATTEPRFLSPWVADLPDHPTIPSPKDHLGHIAGAPGELSRTTKIYGYYRALAAASDRVKVEVIGKSEEGRDILLVFVGDAASLRDLDRFRADAAALADPRRTDEAAMERIVAGTKPLYMLHGGLHSTETGSPEMLMELAYRLAVSDAPHIQLIRDKVVVLINPVAEPDGRDRAVDWYYRHLKGRTDFDNLPPRSPPYWGKYVFHDNNRDGVQRKLALTRATQDAFLKWHPAVVHDLHESIPLLSIWTGTGPYNVNLDPIATTEWHAIAFHEVTNLTGFGMPGVWTYGFGEGWAHIYADSVAINHNAIGRGYETFGNTTADTVERFLDPERERYTGKPVTEPDWYRTSPPPKKFKWSLRNNTNYMQTAVLSALQYTALHGQDMLRRFWRRGANAVKRGQTGEAVRDRDPGEAGRRAAAGRAGQPAARPRHRGPPRAAGVQGEGGRLPGGDVAGPAGPALPRLRARPAHAAEVPRRQGALRALRRRLLGAARRPRRGREARRRRDRSRGAGGAARGAAGARGPRRRRGRRVPRPRHRAGSAAGRARAPGALQGRGRREGVFGRRRGLSRPAPG